MAIIHDRMTRGRSQQGWLDSFHTFSFGNFNDPNRMGFRNLRVLNEDRVIPGGGFAAHDHAHMDILTYVLSGALRHEDSIGNEVFIRPGEMQLMSAGPGVTHSEMNASADEPVHFLQIWLIPDREIEKPIYDSAVLDITPNQFTTIATGAPKDGQLPLQSNTGLLMGKLEDGQTLSHGLDPTRFGFLHIIDGMVEIEGERLSAGDALQFENREGCEITALTDAELILFDMG
ncbi:MAG: pirin family protein [Pseudomonadota bacterium]